MFRPPDPPRFTGALARSTPGTTGSRAGTMPVSLLGSPIDLYKATVTLAASGAQTVVPVSPSPVAGFAPCNQVGYEISVSLLAAANTATAPFVKVILNFFDDDSPAALPVGQALTYYLPAGFGTGGQTPVIVSGAGPLRGKYMTVTLANLDPAVAITTVLLLRGTTRAYSRDDWRWPGGGQVPGFVAPLTGSGSGTLLLAAASVTVNQGSAPAQRILPLFAGKVRLRANVTGLSTADQATVSIATINAEAGSFVYVSPGLGATTAELTPQPEINLPRDCCLLTLTNGAAPSGGNASFKVTLVAEEY